MDRIGEASTAQTGEALMDRTGEVSTTPAAQEGLLDLVPEP